MRPSRRHRNTASVSPIFRWWKKLNDAPASSTPQVRHAARIDWIEPVRLVGGTLRINCTDVAAHILRDIVPAFLQRYLPVVLDLATDAGSSISSRAGSMQASGFAIPFRKT